MYKKLVLPTGIAIAIFVLLLAVACVRMQSNMVRLKTQEEIAAKLNTVIYQLQAEEAAQKAEQELEAIQGIVQAQMAAAFVAGGTEVYESVEKMQGFAREQGLDEILVTEEHGVVCGANTQEFLGFDMNGWDNSRVYLSLLSNTKQKYVQASAQKEADQQAYSYTAVARTDSPGIVRISKKQAPPKETDVRDLLATIVKEKEAVAFAYHKATDEIVVYSKQEKLLSFVPEATWIQNLTKGYSFEKVGDEKYYLSAVVSGEYTIAYGVMKSAMDSFATRQLFYIIVLGLLLLAVACGLLFWSVKKEFILPARILTQRADKDIWTAHFCKEDRVCEQWRELSAALQNSVQTVKEGLSQSERVLEEYRAAPVSIGAVTTRMDEIAVSMETGMQDIIQNSDTQRQAVQALAIKAQVLASQCQKEGAYRQQMGTSLQESLDKLAEDSLIYEDLKCGLTELQTKSMQVSEYSQIVADKFLQTEQLALRAALAAAKAGQNGLDFAQVADRVRLLSKEGAQDAAKLIDMLTQLLQEATKNIGKLPVPVPMHSTAIDLEVQESRLEVENIFGDMQSVLEGVTRIAQDNGTVAEQNEAAVEEFIKKIEELRVLAGMLQ